MSARTRMCGLVDAPWTVCCHDLLPMDAPWTVCCHDLLPMDAPWTVCCRDLLPMAMCGPVEPPRTVRCHGIELLLAGFSVVRIARADRILAPNLLGSPALPIYFTLLASSKSADHYR